MTRDEDLLKPEDAVSYVVMENGITIRFLSSDEDKSREVYNYLRDTPSNNFYELVKFDLGLVINRMMRKGVAKIIG
jgi:hypothetical protein